MMPFSVLRMWTVGLFGWLVLGLGVYFIYEYTQHRRVTNAANERVTRAEIPENVPQPAPPPVEARRPDSTYLIVGILLVALSTCGGFPVVWMLGRFRSNTPHAFKSSRSEMIERPKGSKIYVEHYGPEKAPTLIFTHGWSLDRTEWFYTYQVLAERYHVVLWDLPGLGRSSRPGHRDYSLEKMAGDLEAIVNRNRHQSVVLIGHSIGGMIIQTFCRLFPEHLDGAVKGLVLVHTTYTNPVKTSIAGRWLSAIQKPVLEPLNYLAIWLSPLLWLSNWQSYWNGSLHVSTRLTSFAGEQTWGQIDYSSRMLAMVSPAVIARGNFAMAQFDAQATLPKIPTPTLVVAGVNDRLTVEAASKVLAEKIPHARLVSLAPAGHLGHWEQHVRFNEVLGAFVDEVLAENRKASMERDLARVDAS